MSAVSVLLGRGGPFHKQNLANISFATHVPCSPAQKNSNRARRLSRASSKSETSESIGILHNGNMSCYPANTLTKPEGWNFGITRNFAKRKHGDSFHQHVSILTATAHISKKLSHEFMSTTRNLDQCTTLSRHKSSELQNGIHYVAFCGPLSGGWGLLVTEPDACSAFSASSVAVSFGGAASAPDVTSPSAGEPQNKSHYNSTLDVRF